MNWYMLLQFKIFYFLNFLVFFKNEFFTCIVGIASLKELKLSFIWSLRFLSSALWWALLSVDCSPDPCRPPLFNHMTCSIMSQVYCFCVKSDRSFQYVFLLTQRKHVQHKKDLLTYYLYSYVLNLSCDCIEYHDLNQN